MAEKIPLGPAWTSTKLQLRITAAARNLGLEPSQDTHEADQTAGKKLGRRNVRTGCKTCKRRRVKCDEHRPFCHRCVHFGRKCDGYEANVVAPLRQKVPSKPLAPDPGQIHPSNAAPSVGSALQPLLFATQLEYNYFRLFVDKTSWSLAGDLDRTLWDKIILQACDGEPFLRHAVIALGALDKTLAVTGERGRLNSPEFLAKGDQHHTFALQQYGKAISGMRDFAANPAFDIRKAFIGCLLAVCFECFHGNTQMAINQARAGVQLLNQCLPTVCTKNSTLDSHHTPPPIEDELIIAFNRLDINTVSFFYGPPVPLHQDSLHRSIKALENMPDRFPDLSTAYHHMELMFRVAIHMVIYGYSATEGEDEPVWDMTGEKEVLPSIVWTSYQRTVPGWDKFICFFASWWSAAQEALSQARKIPDAENRHGARASHQAMALEVRFRTCYIAFANIHGVQESYDDDLLDPLKLLDLAGAIHNRRRRSKLLKSGTFVSDGPIIGALHVVTQRSLDSSTRRKAIALLERKAMREGLWDSVMVAKAATLCLKIEEDGAIDGHIAADARIQACRCVFDLARKKGKLQYRKKSIDENGEVTYNHSQEFFRW